MHRHLNLFIAGSIALSMAACGDDGEVIQTPNLMITTTSLQGGTEGVDYNVEVTATGGAASEGQELDYRWSIAGGGLPAGVFLRSEGTPSTAIAGRPRSGGTSTFTLRVSDSEGNEATQDLSIEITAAPAAVAITTEMIPDAMITMPYSATITAENGDGYSWRLLSGQLPPGLTLADSGTPSTMLTGMVPVGSEGRYSFTIQVTDSAGNRSDKQYTMIVIDDRRPLNIVQQNLPAGSVGTAYTANLVAEAGSMTGYTWAVVSGELPPGLTLTATGTPNSPLTGTPTLRGSYAFRVEVTDGEGNKDRESFFIEVNPAPPPLRITTFEIPSGRVGEVYTTNVRAIQGSAMGYSWTVVGGMIPPGLTLMSGTPEATLSGTPTAEGTFDFEVEVRDSLGTAVTQALQTTIAPQIFPVSITATSAVGGILTLPNAEGGQPYAAVLSATDGAPLPPNPTSADVRYNWVVTGGQLPPGLALDVNGQGPDDVGTFTGVPTALGTFTATVTVFDRLNNTASQIIRITVDPPSDPLRITTPAGTPIALAGAGCDRFAISATGGGNAGFTWDIVAGSLPTGFDLGGMGTPSTSVAGAANVPPGDYNVTIRVTDTFNLTATQSFTFTVDANKQGDPRWGVMVGDIDVSGQNDVFVSDLCADPIGAPIRVNTVPASGNGDVQYFTRDIALSPAGNALAFIADLDVDNVDNVYVVDLSSIPTQGSAVRVFTGNPSSTFLDANEIKWSPDGRKLAILTDFTASGADELWVADVSNLAAPGQAVRVSQVGASSVRDVYTNDYDFSPDGNKIAWVGDNEFSSRDYIYVVDLTGATPSAPVTIHGTPSSTGMDVNGGFIWTPDSAGIVFNADFDVVSQDTMYYSDLRGSAPYTAVSLANVPSGRDMDVNFTQGRNEHFAFSPDGTKLFIIGNRVTQFIDDLFLLDYANGVLSNLRAVTALSSSFATCDSGKWSPDSTKIAVRGDLQSSSQDELFIFDVLGTFPAATNQPVRRATTSLEMGFSYVDDYRWSPDSTKIAFIGDFNVSVSDEIYVADITAGGPYTSYRITNHNSSAQRVNEMRWSLDSQRLAFQGDSRSSFDELWVTDVSSLPPGPEFTAHPRFGSTALDVFQNSDTFDNAWFWIGNRKLIARGDLVRSGEDRAYVLDVTNGTDLEPSLLTAPGQVPTANEDVFFLVR